MEFLLTDEQPLFPDTARRLTRIGLRGIGLPGTAPRVTATVNRACILLGADPLQRLALRPQVDAAGSDPMAVFAPGCGEPMPDAPIRRKEGAIK